MRASWAVAIRFKSWIAARGNDAVPSDRDTNIRSIMPWVPSYTEAEAREAIERMHGAGRTRYERLA